jgi:hypothetical protein
MADGDPNTGGDVHVAVEPCISLWLVPWQFAVHAIVGTSIFVVIAAFAVALDLCVHRWLEPYQLSEFIILGLKAAEYALFATDVFLFAVFL